MGWHPAAEAMCHSSFETTEKITLMTVQNVQKIVPEDGTQALVAAISTAGGAVKVVADMIAAGEDGDDINGKARKETMLVAALLIARIMVPGEGHCKIHFSPAAFMASIEAAKRVVNQDLSSFLNNHMVEIYGKTSKALGETLGYWDHISDVGPQFEGFSEALTGFTKH